MIIFDVCKSDNLGICIYVCVMLIPMFVHFHVDPDVITITKWSYQGSIILRRSLDMQKTSLSP